MQHKTCQVSTSAVILFGYALFCSGVVCAAPDEFRTSDGLQVLYDFSETEGDVVKDRSGVGTSYDLRIADLSNVKRIDGRLAVLKPTIIRGQTPPTKLINAVRVSGEISVEAWCVPENTTQSGPARLVTVSKNSSERNVTLGQEAGKFEVRLRTSKSSTNGIPALSSPNNNVTTNLMHVIYTHAGNGSTRIYVNGRQVAENETAGNLSNWDSLHQLAFANELSNDRPWLGTLHLVAIYSRALTAKEITQNFSAGPNGRPSPELLAAQRQRAAARYFETSVAPLLAKHCLECHDSANHENGLDLSKMVTAFRGSENGKVIFPGKAAESPLWASVESNSMPHERTPLTTIEKTVLKKWIDDGATWSLDEIDPAVYAHNGANQNFVQRLTIDEYIETVRATVGVDVEKEARELLPPDLRVDGFSNTAYNLSVDLKHINAYGQMAELIVERMNVDAFVSKLSNKRKFTDNEMGDVISKLGKRILRGPVDEREVFAYRGITTTVASAGGTFDEAMSFVIEAMLQSPRFMYRVERQRGDGSLVRVSDYELASRLSYIIWGGPPDDQLMAAADGGRLNEEEVRIQAARMLQDPRAVKQSLRFVADWLNLNRLKNLRPNQQRFPGWNPQLATAMRLETLAYFEDIVWKQDRPLAALMNSQFTFATPALAEFYGLEAPTATIPNGGTKAPTQPYMSAALDGEVVLQRYDLSMVSGRGGLLTHGSVLTIGGDDASMVTRGLLVMHEFLRGVVNDPPPCVDTTPKPTQPGLTQRSFAMQRIANRACGGCHSKFEPLAFGLEKFDGIGACHDVDEHGNKLQDDGDILFPGASSAVKYKSSSELMDLLADSHRVSQSLTWKATQFSLGRPLVAEDAALVEKVHHETQARGGTWKALMTAIVTSDLVRQTRTEAYGE